MNNKSLLVTCFTSLAVSLGVGSVEANQKVAKNPAVKPPTPEQRWYGRCQDRQPVAEAYSVINLDTGATILAQNEGVQVPIASLTKIMTLLLAAEAIDAGAIREDTKIPIDTSWNIASNGKPITRVLTGWKKPVPFGDVMMAAATESKNDAATSLAIAVAKAMGWGNTEADFVHKMNERARVLGLKFVACNASGLPEAERDVLGPEVAAQMRGSTMADVSKLMRLIVQKYPRLAEMLGTKQTTLQREPYSHILKNLFNFNIPGFSAKAEALKSGMTCAAGYAASIVYGDMVLSYAGAKSHAEREARVKELLQQAHAYQELSRAIMKEQTPR